MRKIENVFFFVFFFVFFSSVLGMATKIVNLMTTDDEATDSEMRNKSVLMDESEDEQEITLDVSKLGEYAILNGFDADRVQEVVDEAKHNEKQVNEYAAKEKRLLNAVEDLTEERDHWKQKANQFESAMKKAKFAAVDTAVQGMLAVDSAADVLAAKTREYQEMHDARDDDHELLATLRKEIKELKSNNEFLENNTYDLVSAKDEAEQLAAKSEAKALKLEEDNAELQDAVDELRTQLAVAKEVADNKDAQLKLALERLNKEHEEELDELAKPKKPSVPRKRKIALPDAPWF